MREKILKLASLFSFQGIKGRWLFNSQGMVIMIVFVSVTIYTVAAANFYYGSVQTSLESRANATANFFSKYINKSYSDYRQSAFRFAEEFKDGDKLELQFVNLAGRIELSTTGYTLGLAPQTGDVSKALKSAQIQSWVGTDPLTGEHVMSVSAPLLFSGDQVIGVMRYVTSMRGVDKRIFTSMGVAVLIGLVVIIFVFTTNLYFIRSIVAAIQEINETAKKIAGGSYGIHIEKKYEDEIGELCDTINNMSSEISATERMKNDFVSSVSHELRSPLTAIAGWGETLLASDMKDTAEARKGLRIILKEATRLSKMVEEMLDFTRLESGRLTLQMEEFDIRGEFEEVVFMYMDTLSRSGIEMEYEETDEEEIFPDILGDRAKLKQVFFNLFDNAVTHGGDGKRIRASIRVEQGEVTITIRDFGQGISAEELPYVKKKFYKGNVKSRGSGIGLALSDEIVRMHDGTLEITSQPGEGTEVTVRLPVRKGGKNADD